MNFAPQPQGIVIPASAIRRAAMFIALLGNEFFVPIEKPMAKINENSSPEEFEEAANEVLHLVKDGIFSSVKEAYPGGFDQYILDTLELSVFSAAIQELAKESQEKSPPSFNN